MANQDMPALPDIPETPPEPEIKLEFTQAQLDAAREDGYIAGHNAALEEAGTAREHYVADAINLIAQNLEKLDEQQKAANTVLADLAMRMVYGIAQRLLREWRSSAQSTSAPRCRMATMRDGRTPLPTPTRRSRTVLRSCVKRG